MQRVQKRAGSARHVSDRCTGRRVVRGYRASLHGFFVPAQATQRLLTQVSCVDGQAGGLGTLQVMTRRRLCRAGWLDFIVSSDSADGVGSDRFQLSRCRSASSPLLCDPKRAWLGCQSANDAGAAAHSGLNSIATPFMQ
jgi:hypothetical protein